MHNSIKSDQPHEPFPVEAKATYDSGAAAKETATSSPNIFSDPDHDAAE